jgi:HPt (histidine-containing phosphotransfer) domain-containing protein
MDDYLSKPLRASALERMLARYVKPEASAPSRPSTAPRAERALSDNDPNREAPKLSSLARQTEGLAEAFAAEQRPVLANDVIRSPALIDLCLREAPKQLALLEDALARGAASELRAAAHKLKGTAMALAADGMAEMAERLQHCAEQARLPEAALLVEQLNGAYLLVEDALERERAQKRESA